MCVLTTWVISCYRSSDPDALFASWQVHLAESLLRFVAGTLARVVSPPSGKVSKRRKKGHSSSPAAAAASEPEPLTPESEAEHLQNLNNRLKEFWAEQLLEMENLSLGNDHSGGHAKHIDYKNYIDLPLARIKRIMKSDEDVHMISAEVLVLFAKACEMFILEMTIRSWSVSERSKRRTLQRDDIQNAIANTDTFDFLLNII